MFYCDEKACRRRVPTWYAAVVQLPSIFCPGTDSKLGWHWRRPCLQSAPDLPVLCEFFVLWPWPLTFSTENWNFPYSCLGERLRQSWFFSTFLCFPVTNPYGRVGQTDRQTDGWARRVMQPIGRPHNDNTICFMLWGVNLTTSNYSRIFRNSSTA